MSQKYILSCNQCNYSSEFKIGKSSNQEAWIEKLKVQIRENRFGEETRLFLENHPDVKINAFWQSILVLLAVVFDNGFE